MSRDRSPAPAPADLLDLDGSLDEETLSKAQELLSSLAGALFPEGPPSRDRVTWPDHPEVRALSNDGSIAGVEERLRHAEARFRTLVEQIPAVTFMAVLGEGQNEVYVSPHIEQMLGYTQEEWLADPFLWYYRLHPDDRGVWNEEFARGCRSGGPFRAECRFMARDGRVVWVLGEARVVKDELGRPQFLQGVAFDITESKRAQQVLMESAVRQARVEEELEIARRMQTSILPTAPRLDGLEIGASMVPADEVGGDYYDVFAAQAGGWLAIADVSGHGLNAGLVMMMVQSALSAIASARGNTTPREALSLLNEVLFDNIGQRLERPEYVTMTLLRYHPSGRVTFAGAHQDVLICRAETGRVERVATPGPWLGVRRHIRSRMSDHSLTLQRGDLLVLYTDGILESVNDRGELFDIHRLCSSIEELRHQSPQSICDELIEQVKRWAREQEDDLTLVVARYLGT